MIDFVHLKMLRKSMLHFKTIFIKFWFFCLSSISASIAFYGRVQERFSGDFHDISSHFPPLKMLSFHIFTTVGRLLSLRCDDKTGIDDSGNGETARRQRRHIISNF